MKGLIKVNFPGTDQPYQIRHHGESGALHSVDDKPSFMTFYRTGELMREIWHKEGEVHREGNKPASIIYNRDGSIKHECYFMDGDEVA